MNHQSKALQVLHYFKTINNVLRKQIYKLADDSPFTAPQLSVISLLTYQDGLKVSELSKRSGLSESTISGIVDRLVKQEYLIRKRSETDRRVVNIYLAEGCLEEYEKFRKVKDGFFISLFEDFSEEEVDTILHGLSLLEQKTKEPISE